MRGVRAVAAVTLIAACSCGDSTPAADASLQVDAAEPLAFTAGPTFTLGPNPNGPLTGELEVSTNRPARLTIAIADDDRSLVIELPALALAHDVPVLGFRSGRMHAVTITATDQAGQTVMATPFDVMTPMLPPGFPAFLASRIGSAQIEPGVTFTALLSYLLAVDDEGEVVWFIDVGRETTDVRRLPNGNMLFGNRDHSGGAEVDMFGNLVRRWHAAKLSSGDPDSTPVAIDSMHHELAMLPSGDLLTLSTERRTYDGYRTSEVDPTPGSAQDLIGDVVVVFQPDGTIVTEWSLLDRLDPQRVGYGSFSSFWSEHYPPPNVLDWSHGNAVVIDPSDGGAIISLRHQDAIVKLDASGALLWILGSHDNWSTAYQPLLLTPVGVGPFAWPFHQHAPKLLGNGHLLVFDNGNVRVSPPAAIDGTGQYSRAVEYAIDPATKQVEQVWEFDADQAIFAAATGDVDVGSVTGNVIITFGVTGRILEVTHDAAATVVFEPSSPVPLYRSERLPLYPAAAP
ncbi:MAG: aryl-sulfate sulfotransferase [Kofleriaceae bacterium]